MNVRVRKPSTKSYVIGGPSHGEIVDLPLTQSIFTAVVSTPALDPSEELNTVLYKACVFRCSGDGMDVVEDIRVFTPNGTTHADLMHQMIRLAARNPDV